MMSMSVSGVAIPLLLFFWKQCRTNELHRVDRSVGATDIVLDDLQHAGTAEALEYLGRIVLVAQLSQRQRITETPTHVGRQRHQILVAARDPFERFLFIDHDRILYLFR